MFLCEYMCVCVSACVCVCLCVCASACVCVCAYVLVHMSVYGEFLCFFRFWRALFVTGGVQRVEPLITALLETMGSGHIYGRASLRSRSSPSFSRSLSFPVCLCSFLRSWILFSLVDTQSTSATTIIS